MVSEGVVSPAGVAVSFVKLLLSCEKKYKVVGNIVVLEMRASPLGHRMQCLLRIREDLIENLLEQ